MGPIKAVQFTWKGLGIMRRFVSGEISEQECGWQVNALRARYGLKDKTD